MFRPTRRPSSGLQSSKRLNIAIFSLLELCKPDDGLRVGRNMFHKHLTNKLVVFWRTLPFYFIVTHTTGMPQLGRRGRFVLKCFEVCCSRCS